MKQFYKFNLKSKLTSSALGYALTFSLLIGLVCSGMLIISSVNKRLEVNYTTKEYLIFNNLFALNYGSKLVDKESEILYHPSGDTSTIQLKKWGAFQIAVARTFNGNKLIEKSALIGAKMSSSLPCFYLSDNGQPLKLGGATKIEGIAFLPERGVERAYISGKNYINNELIYYQAHGEQTILNNAELNYLNGLDLMKFRLDTKANDGLSGGKRKIGNNNIGTFADERNVTDRKVRNTLIHNLKNKEVDKLGEFNVYYFDNVNDVLTYPEASSSTKKKLQRDTRNGVNIDNHPAGFKVLNQDGTYYTYGLPAYNNKEVENVFSTTNPYSNMTPSEIETINSISTVDKNYYKVPGTDKYINKTTKSPYAHSYLLTSVQGADYIDVKNDGPTDDDKGYWVKFNYIQTATNYKWRTPYDTDQYNAGKLWTLQDDKASYNYGEKELWYLAQIETKSHIAVFKLSSRDDMKSAKAENYQNGQTADMSALKVDEIRIYDKKSFKNNPNCIALQVVHFKYANSNDPINPMTPLCQNTPNASHGKLTLQEVWFTSNGSTRGELSKYKFEYRNTDNTESEDNPSYVSNSYDSWGSYKPRGSNYEFQVHFPYINQFNQNWNSTNHPYEPSYNNDLADYNSKLTTKETQDKLVSAWSLKKITLPSGGEINIQYESDDYAYVQHKVANQMFKIEKLGDGDGRDDNEIYHKGDDDANNYHDDNSYDDELRRRIYFKLEYPIPVSTQLGTANLSVYNDYVVPIIKDESGQRNLYYKTKARLVDQIYDYISGYLPLENNFMLGSTHYNYGVNPNLVENIDLNGDGNTQSCYTTGFVTVQSSKKKNGAYFDKYHPLALAGWTYLQTNANKLLNSSSQFADMGKNPSTGEVLNLMSSIMSIVPATAANFGNIRHYCRKKNLVKSIDLDKSIIRLASPDKIKYGGGHRVKQITITDNWSSDVSGEISREYGQIYDYTIEENGKIISSGVAQYEPQAGGDENPLKYPIYYFDKQNLFTKNNLFAEAPLNESLYPGASVGYRKVTVKSLNTNSQLKNISNARGRIGGVNVHSFYTAKEFPTLVENTTLGEENGTKDYFNLPIPIPLIGTIKRNYYHGVQSYKIELNDMHGKVKSIETFEFNGYDLNPNPITSTTYEYQMKPISLNNELVYQLDNYVNIIKNDDTHAIQGTKSLMGVDVDLSTDQRETKSFNNSGSFDSNVEFAGLPFPDFWINYSNSKSMFRTYVSNKVIHKTGILVKTKSRDLQTKSETEILAYDEKSGTPILSKIKNEFGDDFYSYNIPAYYKYDRMGHAYQNINYSFQTDFISVNDVDKQNVRINITNNEILNLVRGDELLITESSETGDNYKKGYFVGFDYSNNGQVPQYGIVHFGSQDALINDNASLVSLKVIRSGYRNHYSSSTANYLTKGKITDVALGVNSVNVTTTSDGYNIKTNQINVPVLSASATLYKDDWLSVEVQDRSTDLNIIDNPFLTGNSGIYRPYKTYSYVGKRSQRKNGDIKFVDENNSTVPELFNDGVMESVPMFTWDIGDLEEYLPKWEWVNEVTKFSSDAYELENVNRLGIFSSALYGYDNSLTIGVGGNSSYSELGVSDFETSNEQEFFGESMRQTNLNFYNTVNNKTEFATTEHFNIISAKYTSEGILEVITNIPYGDYQEMKLSGKLLNNFGMTLNSTKNNSFSGNKGFYFNTYCPFSSGGGGRRLLSTGDSDPQALNLPSGNTCATSIYASYKGKSDSYTKLYLKPIYAIETETFDLLKYSSEYTGKIAVLLRQTAHKYDDNLMATTEFVSNKSHTGKKSIKINNTVYFNQYDLKLIKNKEYVISMWISRDNTNVSSYASQNQSFKPIEIGVLNSSGNVDLITNSKFTYGKVIEGWQKVDVEFSVPNNFQTLSIKLNSGNTPLYIDDIRFSPKTGGVSTYVYDPLKYWLRASLNVDNYATLFYYNEEGNLTLKKQETEKGIFTLTESRGHVSEGN